MKLLSETANGARQLLHLLHLPQRCTPDKRKYMLQANAGSLKLGMSVSASNR
jgi:hypothetical protein